MAEEPPRLYSRQSRVPIDIIAPEHGDVHIKLERWSFWNRERYEPATCNSIEKKFEKGGRDATPPATAPMLVNPLYLRVERAVILAGVQSPQHGDCLRFFYVQRYNLFEICRRLNPPKGIRWEDLPTWTYDSREMVRVILEELEP